MSGSISSPSSGRGRRNQDFDLNITALIDCFTVLIAFMLVAATFVSVGILDAGVAAAGATAVSSEPPQHLLTIEMKANHTFGVKVSGKDNFNQQISNESGVWNYEGLAKQLEEIKKKWPTLNAATLVAENSVEYQDVIKSMEVTRKAGTSVLLGGF